jgi:hypothetical protein
MRLRIPKSLIVGTTMVVAAAAGALAVMPDALATSSVNGIWKVVTVYLDEGASKAWVWNNANSDMYVAGAVPTADEECQIRTTVRYRRTSTGARSVVVQADNIWRNYRHGCQVTVYLVGLKADRTSARGVLSPGGSSGVAWRNSAADRYVYVAGAVPGTPSSGTCQLEVESRMRTRPSGEDQFLPTVRNTGSVDCEANLTYGWLDIEETGKSGNPGGIAEPGWTGSSVMGDPGSFRAYAVGLDTKPTSDGDCYWAISDKLTSNENSVGGAQALFHFSNVGDIPCPEPIFTVAYFE